MKNIFTFLICLLFVNVSIAQNNVTEIWTNYNGFWNSSSTSINPILPNNSHELLAFRFGTTIYSTGVDDAKLTANGITTFTPLTVRALPIASLPLTGISSYFIGLGNLIDGILLELIMGQQIRLMLV
jgi:hypothetical protein